VRAVHAVPGAGRGDPVLPGDFEHDEIKKNLTFEHEEIKKNLTFEHDELKTT
jgi:hypothetical protein